MSAAETRSKRGDWNADMSMRFWGYCKGVAAWMTPERFDAAKEKLSYHQSLANVDRSLVAQLQKLCRGPRGTNWPKPKKRRVK